MQNCAADGKHEKGPRTWSLFGEIYTCPGRGPRHESPRQRSRHVTPQGPTQRPLACAGMQHPLTTVQACS